MYNDKINYKYKTVGYILVLIIHNKSILKANLYAIHKLRTVFSEIVHRHVYFYPHFVPIFTDHINIILSEGKYRFETLT